MPYSPVKYRALIVSTTGKFGFLSTYSAQNILGSRQLK